MEQKDINICLSIGMLILFIFSLSLMYSSRNINRQFDDFSSDVTDIEFKLQQRTELNIDNINHLKNNLSLLENYAIRGHAMVVDNLMEDWQTKNNINDEKLLEIIGPIQQLCQFTEPDNELSLFQKIGNNSIIVNVVTRNNTEVSLYIYANYSIQCLNEEDFGLVDCMEVC